MFVINYVNLEETCQNVIKIEAKPNLKSYSVILLLMLPAKQYLRHNLCT